MQDLLDDVAPTVNSAAVENNISAAEVDSIHSTEKDGVSNSLESHPLQLDTVSSSGSLHTLSAISTDLKKGARDPESLAGGAGSHGACLTLNDHDHIRQFIQEFTFRGLLPHIEKNIRQLNDQVELQVFTLDIFKLILIVIMEIFKCAGNCECVH